MRIYHYKLYNELTLILLNNLNLFHIVIMNFIINMLFIRDSYTGKINDIILILINKLTKHVIYIAITKNLKINKLINII